MTSRPAPHTFRTRLAWGLTVLVLAVSGLDAALWQRSPWINALAAVGFRPGQDKGYTQGSTAGSVQQLLDWIRTRTQPRESWLADWAVSPTILTYTERPTNLHCFFEAPLREKFRAFAFALFEEEEALYTLCQKWRTDYVLYTPPWYCRTDAVGSYRYITAHLTTSATDAVLTGMQFAPDSLQHFQLVYSNPFYRVFRVLRVGRDRVSVRPEDHPYCAIYDATAFSTWAPRLAKGSREDWPYFASFITAYNCYDQGISLLQASRNNSDLIQPGMGCLSLAVRAQPLLYEAHAALGTCWANLKRYAPARRALERSLAINPDQPWINSMLAHIPQGATGEGPR